MKEFDEIEELRQEVRALAGLINHWLKRTEVDESYLRTQSKQKLERRENPQITPQNSAIYLALVDTAQKVKKLADLSQKISSMVALISTIELRMNLLSINAAIEATKLGKTGLPLVIIADEVQHLANTFANYFQKIEELLPKIQGDIVKTMGALEEAMQLTLDYRNFKDFQLETKVDFINQTIMDIRELSQDIYDIINWIYKNVKKMNSLALKASGEAARLGQRGKGFLVIVYDINMLAKKSTKGVKEIEAIALKINREFSQTLQAKDKLLQAMKELKTTEFSWELFDLDW